MNLPIATSAAKQQGLPGSDVYRYPHILYLDELHRDWGAVRLNIEAVKAFADTIVVSQRAALAEHRSKIQEWIAKGGLKADLPMPRNAASDGSMKYMNYENLKLACGFELHLKARLLSRDFILHRLDNKVSTYKALALEQEKRPVTRSELRAIQDFQFDGRHNFLPGLTETSLKFSWMTDKPAYRAATGLSDRDLDIIGDLRKLRNQIHLPGDFPTTPALQSFGAPIVEFVLPFVNAEIVDLSNAIIARRNFTFQPLSRFN